MVHGYGADAKWFATLIEIDEVFADKVRAGGCADCGGPLDRADYERKPRGDLGEAAEAYRRRRSFCCRREGCRHRATPPSERFLGRKVYVAVLVVVASVLGRQQVLVGRGAPRQVQGVPVRRVPSVRFPDFIAPTARSDFPLSHFARSRSLGGSASTARGGNGTSQVPRRPSPYVPRLFDPGGALGLASGTVSLRRALRGIAFQLP